MRVLIYSIFFDNFVFSREISKRFGNFNAPLVRRLNKLPWKLDDSKHEKLGKISLKSGKKVILKQTNKKFAIFIIGSLPIDSIISGKQTVGNRDIAK